MTNITPLKPAPSATGSTGPGGASADGSTFAGILAVIGASGASTAPDAAPAASPGPTAPVANSARVARPTLPSKGTSATGGPDSGGDDASGTAPAASGAPGAAGTAAGTGGVAGTAGASAAAPMLALAQQVQLTGPSTVEGPAGTGAPAAGAFAAGLAPGGGAPQVSAGLPPAALTPGVAALAQQGLAAGALKMAITEGGQGQASTRSATGPATVGAANEVPSGAVPAAQQGPGYRPAAVDVEALAGQPGLSPLPGPLGPQSGLPQGSVPGQGGSAAGPMSGEAAASLAASRASTGPLPATTGAVSPGLPPGLALPLAGEISTTGRPGTSTGAPASPGQVPGQPTPSATGRDVPGSSAAGTASAAAQQLLADGALVSKASANGARSAAGNGPNGLPLARSESAGPVPSGLLSPLDKAAEGTGWGGLAGQAGSGGHPGPSGGPGQHRPGHEGSPPLRPAAAGGGTARTGLLSAPGAMGQHPAEPVLGSARPGAGAHLRPDATAGMGPVPLTVSSGTAVAAQPGTVPLGGPAVMPNGVVTGPALSPMTTGPLPAGASDALHGDAAASLPDQITAALLPAAHQADGSYQVNIRLHPEELGVVHVEMHLEAGTVSVSLHADGDATRDMLRQNLGHLRQQMADGGLTTGHFDVGSGPGTGQWGSSAQLPKPQMVEGPGLSDSPLGGMAPAISPAAASFSTAGNTQLDMRL